MLGKWKEKALYELTEMSWSRRGRGGRSRSWVNDIGSLQSVGHAKKREWIIVRGRVDTNATQYLYPDTK
jgi:hypothetical protein